MRLICAVCNHPIDESVHVEIDVTHTFESHDNVEEFVMPDLCAENTIDNWDKPP